MAGGDAVSGERGGEATVERVAGSQGEGSGLRQCDGPRLSEAFSTLVKSTTAGAEPTGKGALP